MKATTKATTKAQTASLKVFKSGNYEYIYIYFKLRKGVIRVNTGNKFTSYKMTKELLFNSSEPNHREANAKTLELLEKVNGYIKYKLSTYRGEVEQKECLHYITSSNYTRGLNNVLIRVNDFTGIETQIKPDKTVLDYFQDFVTYKEKQLKGNSNSVGNYWSLKKNLEDFQTLKGETLTFERINNKEFIIDFKQYLSDLKVFKQAQQYMNANTVNSKLNYLKTFYLWIIENEIYSLKPSSYKFDSKRFKTIKQALTKADLIQLLNLKDLSNREQIIVDMFICNSLMGLRFSDLQSLTKANVMQHATGEYFIVQTNQKTGIEVQIEVQPTSLTILQKYGFKFPSMVLKSFNRKLENILESHNLFNELVTTQKRENNTTIDTQVMRRTLIHSHSMRRNFINIALTNNVPLPSIMKATGHRLINTVTSYVQPVSNVNAFRALDLMTA